MGQYYRRDGSQYNNVLDWAKDFEKLDRAVKQETLSNGYRVSTVFLVLNHNFGGGKPLIFETMVFEGNNFVGLDADRYSTEKEAIEGHKRMVEKWKSKQ